jgi:hypothetical protein
VSTHLHVIYISAATGLIFGCILQAVPQTRPSIYNNVLALDVAAVMAAFLTTVWVWWDFHLPKQSQSPSTLAEDELKRIISDNHRQYAISGATTDFDLSIMNEATLQRVRTEALEEAMGYLCLGVDVDTGWDELPLVIRRAIVSRIVGRQVSEDNELRDWIEKTGIDQQKTDSQLFFSLGIYQRTWQRRERGDAKSPAVPEQPPSSNILEDSLVGHANPVKQATLLHAVSGLIIDTPVTAIKWVSIITGGAFDAERELWYCLQDSYFRERLLTAVLAVWKVCWQIKNAWVYVLMIYHRRALAHISHLARKGASRVLKKNTVVVQLSRKFITGFASRNEQDTLTLSIFPGRLDMIPCDKEPSSVAVYDDKSRLSSRTDQTGQGSRVSTYEYKEGNPRRWPDIRKVVEGSTTMRCHYDGAGRVSYGTLTLSSTSYVFRYGYKSGEKYSRDILKADFHLAESECRDSLTVYWGSPVRTNANFGWANRDWVPSDKVCCVIRFIGGKTYVTTWEYVHRRDPIVTSFLQDGESKSVVTDVPAVFKDESALLIRPTRVSFDDEDLLIHHSRRDVRWLTARAKTSLISRLNPLAWFYGLQKAKHRRVPTWWLRSELWHHWLKAGTVDAVTACWMDELILREEPLLKGYWRARNFGRLHEARQFLNRNIEQIVAAIEIERDVSEVCVLPIKAADLFAMGQGKDANEITHRPEDCYKDIHNRISVIFNDVGCWPEAPGGVSNCRRDLINGHSTIRNHVLAETANDYGIPRFQVERSVQSMKLLPLWGIDGKTPNHGILNNLLQSQVDNKIRATDLQRDIVGTFVPLLKLFVKGARTKEPSRAELLQYSQVFMELARFFEERDYNMTWQSKEVMSAWINAWLTPYNHPNMREPADCFEIEQPSMKDFEACLAIYSCYFFIFTVQIPEECPRVFQSTHHGISSLFGIILKYRRGVTFGIWDHAILWRESCLNISPAQCSLSIPVQSMLLAGIGLATRLAYLHADVILPCTSVFNP